MWAVNPGSYAILELFTENNEETLLANEGMMIWGNMNSVYAQASEGYNSGSDFSAISYKFEGWSSPNEIGYMESHDEERIAYGDELYGNSGGIYKIKDTTTTIKRQELCNTSFLTIPGPKMIWMFGELGYDTSINYNGRTGDKPVLWNYYFDPRRKQLHNVVSSLINLKETYPVFSTSNYSIFASGNIKQIELLGNDTDVEILGNFDVYGDSYTLTFPSTGPWYEFFTGDTLNLTSTSYEFNLNPGEYRLYSNYVFKGSGTLSAINQKLQSNVSVFPNPFVDNIYLNSNKPIVKASLWNMTGQEVLSQKGGSLNSVQAGGLESGMYILFVQFNDGTNQEFKVLKH